MSNYRSSGKPTKLGDTGHYGLVTTNTSDVPSAPGSTPVATIYAGSDLVARASGKTATVTLITGLTGEYDINHAMTAGNGYSVGGHVIRVTYTMAAAARTHLIDFNVT